MRKPYPTELSDAEWNYIQPHLPAPKGHGRLRTHDLREILNATFYLLKSGCQWRLLPTSGPDASSLDVEGGYPVPVYSFPITTSNPKKNGYRMTTKKRMIKISIEVMRGSTRFKVAAQAESIEEALEMARRYNSGKECKVVFPIDPEGFFVRDNKISPTSPTPATSTTVSTRVWS